MTEFLIAEICNCYDELNSSSVSFHRQTVLEDVFHGTQEEVCSSLYVHRHIINQYLTSSKCFAVTDCSTFVFFCRQKNDLEKRWL